MMLNDFWLASAINLIDLEHALDSNNLKDILSKLENDNPTKNRKFFELFFVQKFLMLTWKIDIFFLHNIETKLIWSLQVTTKPWTRETLFIVVDCTLLTYWPSGELPNTLK